MDSASLPVLGSVERRSTKKWMPTQHGGNGHVSGVESMNRKNMEKHGEWGSWRLTPHFWPLLPAVAAFKTVKAFSDLRCQTMEVAETAPARTITRRVASHPVIGNPGIYENSDMMARKGMKTDRMDAKHMKSNCASDREIWQRCVKERYNKGVDCGVLLEQFRQCQDGGAAA